MKHQIIENNGVPEYAVIPFDEFQKLLDDSERNLLRDAAYRLPLSLRSSQEKGNRLLPCYERLPHSCVWTSMISCPGSPRLRRDSDQGFRAGASP